MLHGNVDLLTEVKVWNSCWVLLVKGFDGEHGKMVRARSTFFALSPRPAGYGLF